MSRGAVGRARGTLAVLRELPRQRRAPYLPRERMLERRDARVRECVRYAAASVPFYRELFGREGLDPREVQTAEDLARLPLLEKSQVQRDPESFRATTQLGLDALAFTTSGSTGMPATIYHDRASLLANIAWGEREREVETRLCGRRWRYPVVQITFASSTNRRVLDFYGRSSFRPLRPRTHALSVADRVEHVVDTINRIRPTVVRGYGAYLETLFRTMHARGLALHTPRVVVYGGDTMSEAGRRFIEERFGSLVLSRYTAVEAFKIGFTCEERRGFHLHEDLCHVSVVGPDGRALPDGERGEVVVSYLANRGSVLLNYRLGDLARASAGGCRCGRTSKMLTDLEGRVDELLELPDGTLVHPIQAERTIRQHDGVLRFRLAQRTPSAYALRLATADQESYTRVVNRVLPELRTLLRDCAIDAERDQDLLRHVQGPKFRSILALPKGDA